MPQVYSIISCPEYSPPGDLTREELEGPEFQILNSTNSIGYINEIDKLTVRQLYMTSCLDEWLEEEPGLFDDAESMEEDFFGNYAHLISLADSPSRLVDHLNILLSNGLLSSETRQTIVQSISSLTNKMDRVRLALYLVMISPDYAILK